MEYELCRPWPARAGSLVVLASHLRGQSAAWVLRAKLCSRTSISTEYGSSPASNRLLAPICHNLKRALQISMFAQPGAAGSGSHLCFVLVPVLSTHSRDQYPIFFRPT